MDLLDDLLHKSEEKGELASDGGVEIEDIEEEDWKLNVCPYYNDTAVELEPGTVHLYPKGMDDELKDIFSTLARSSKREYGSVDRDDIEDEVSKLKDLDKAELDEIIGFFSDIIRGRHVDLLRDCLYLQKAVADEGIRLNHPIGEYKDSLKEDFGRVAFYMNHLVSTGYFNENEFFQSMYDEIQDQDGATSEIYMDEFDKIVEERLLAYYVNNDEDVQDTFNGINRLVYRYFHFDPHNEFVDVRGLGEECEELIGDGLAKFEDTQSGELITQELDSVEMAVRIYPQSMELLS